MGFATADEAGQPSTPATETPTYAPPKAWSYSAWNFYDGCPYKYLLKNILKVPDPGTPEMAEGDRIHKLGEAYIKGQLDEVPV